MVFILKKCEKIRAQNFKRGFFGPNLALKKIDKNLTLLPVLAPHGVDHLGGEFHGRGHRLRVTAQDEAKVHVEHFAYFVGENYKIIQKKMSKIRKICHFT